MSSPGDEDGDYDGGDDYDYSSDESYTSTVRAYADGCEHLAVDAATPTSDANGRYGRHPHAAHMHASNACAVFVRHHPRILLFGVLDLGWPFVFVK